MNHHNFQFSGGVPLSAGDRYYAQDLARDFYHQQDAMGSQMLSLLGLSPGTPALTKIGIPTVDVPLPNNVIDVPAWSGILPATVTIPLAFSGLPSTTQNVTANIPVQIQASAVNVTTLGATGAGTAYKLYASYSELNGNTRSRAKATGSYNYEVTPGVTYGVTTGAIPATAVLVATFTYNSGSSPITSIVPGPVTVAGQRVISLTTGSPYNLASGSCDILEINATTNPFIVNLPKASGSGWKPKIVNTSALATGLVKLVPFSGDKIGPLAANVAAYLQNVDQSGWTYNQQYLELIDTVSGQWAVVAGQFMPEPGSVDAAGSQYFLGKLRHLPLGNTTSRLVTSAAPPSAGSWSSAKQVTGSFGIPSGAKAIRAKIFIGGSTGTNQGLNNAISVAFSDNNSSTPSADTSHPIAGLNWINATTSVSGSTGYYSEIDIPLNSSGQFYLYTLNALGILVSFCTVSVWAVGYYMGD